MTAIGQTQLLCYSGRHSKFWIHAALELSLEMMNKQEPHTLYHYTNSAVLASIIQSRKIRLSARWHLNDPCEGEDFENLLKEYISAEHAGEEKARMAMESLDNLHFYVACFSEHGDLLSQWRAYAQDGEGVSIGFDREYLFKCLATQSEMVARPVEYADNLGDLNSNGEACTAFSTILTHGETPRDNVLQTLAKIRWTIKRKAYQEEKEHRLILTPANTTPISKSLGKTKVKRQFFGAKTEIRDYVEVEFDAIDWALLISEIVIGPKNRTNLTVLQDFLEENGLLNTKIRFSAAHYR